MAGVLELGVGDFEAGCGSARRWRGCYSGRQGWELENAQSCMWIGQFVEKQAKWFYPRRIAITTTGTAAAIAIYMIPRMLRVLGQRAHGIHVLRFALPVLIWSWSLYFLCVWFHPRRGMLSRAERVSEDTASRGFGMLRAVFLCILCLLFLSPLALWTVLLLW